MPPWSPAQAPLPPRETAGGAEGFRPGTSRPVAVTLSLHLFVFKAGVPERTLRDGTRGGGLSRGPCAASHDHQQPLAAPLPHHRQELSARPPPPFQHPDPGYAARPKSHSLYHETRPPDAAGLPAPHGVTLEGDNPLQPQFPHLRGEGAEGRKDLEILM